MKLVLFPNLGFKTSEGGRNGKPFANPLYMKWVYLIQSIDRQDQVYVGITGNLEYRLRSHNLGQSSHSSKWRPWQVLVAMRFENDDKAAKFERYLKSGSGQAFLKRHFK